MRRRTAAAGLQRVLKDARHPRRGGLSCAAPVCRDEVLTAEPALLAILRRLEDDRPVSRYGVARVREALVDASSPLYLASTPGALRDWARLTLEVMNDGPD
jgi:hypothetical protein